MHLRADCIRRTTNSAVTVKPGTHKVVCCRNQRQLGNKVDCRRYGQLCCRYGRLCRQCVHTRWRQSIQKYTLATIADQSNTVDRFYTKSFYPRTRRRLGNRAFSVAGPAAWNSLPPDIRTASTLCSFKNLLKTHLFFSFISVIYLISKSVCCTAPL